MPLPAEVRPLLRRLEIVSRRQLAGSLAGEYRTAFRGQGLEFAELRPYEAGDDPRHIDWRVTARTGAPHVRRYREERSRTLLLLADLSASFTPAKRQLQLEAAALLAFAAVTNRDRVALVAFSDRVEHLMAPASGRNHVLRLLTDLLTLRPAGSKTDLRPPLEAALALGRRSSLVALLSDFHAPLPAPLLRRVAARHDLLGVVLRDARESRLPAAGLLLCRDLESEEERLLDLASGRAADALARGWQETDRQLAAALGKLGVDHAFLASGASLLPPLRTLFARRRRRR